MNKLFFSIIALGLFGSLPVSAATSSGACSWHGGVSCGAGSDWDGSVICKDGWRDSSVNYSDVQECKSSCIKVSPETYSKLLKDENCSGEYSLMLENQRNALINARFNNKFDVTPEQSAALTQVQKDAIQNKDSGSLELLLGEVTAKNKSRESACKAAMDLLSLFCPDVSMEQIQCPNNSVLINGQCTCKSGYFWKNNSCLTLTQACQESYGSNTYGVQESDGRAFCYCAYGFQWNNSQTKCELLPVTTYATETKSTIPSVSSNVQPLEDFLASEKAQSKRTIVSAYLKYRGFFVIQQGNNRLWYIHPTDKKRYLIDSPSGLLTLLQKKGRFVNEKQLKSVYKYPKNYRGNLIVETKSGAHLYINPSENKIYDIGIKDALLGYNRFDLGFEIVKGLAKRLSDAEIRKVMVGDL